MIEYFFCNSYQPFLLAIHYHTNNSKLTIITSNLDIAKACQFLNVEYIQIPSYKIKDLIFKSSLVRSTILELKTKIGTSVVGFSHRQFAYDCFILINEVLRNGGKACLLDLEIIYTEKASFKKHYIKYLKTVLFRIIIEIKYNISLETVAFGNAITNAIGRNFFGDHKNSNLSIIELKTEYYDIVLNLSKTFHINSINFKHLFIDQVFPVNSFIDTVKLNSIKKILLEIKGLSIKPHPGHSSLSLYQDKITIPEFMPAELIFNNIKNTIISIYSSVLFSASRIPTLRIISILPIVVKPNYDYTLYKNIIIEKTNNRVEFIYDINDLVTLLNNTAD